MLRKFVCVEVVSLLVGCSSADQEGNVAGSSGAPSVAIVPAGMGGAPGVLTGDGAAGVSVPPSTTQGTPPAPGTPPAQSTPPAGTTNEPPVMPPAGTTNEPPVMPPAGTTNEPPVMPPGVPPPEGFKPNAMDECNLNSGWPGDEYCILPPPSDKGFQVHFGPSNYESPEPMFVLQPGEEWVHKFAATSANDQDIKFYVRQYRMRPGAHHTIVRDTSTGRRLSGSDVNQDHPPGGIVAPENAGVGIPLAAHVPISADHHAINTTDRPLLQEVWVNFWYVDPSKVTETTTLLYDPGSITDTVAPYQDVVLGPYQCDIESPGRLINMFGHVHANNVRFTAWRTRRAERELIYESYHWEEPLWLEFTSIANNPPPSPAALIDGGRSGIVDLQPGDTLEWECHEVNQHATPLRFVNKTYEGWMCIIIGELVGTSCKSRTGIDFNPIFE